MSPTSKETFPLRFSLSYIPPLELFRAGAVAASVPATAGGRGQEQAMAERPAKVTQV